MAMTCPPDLAPVLLDIVRVAILRARAHGWAGRAEAAAAEMDHVHNLPGLLTDFSADGLRYYLDVERPSFLRRDPSAGRAFAACWQRLDDHASPLRDGPSPAASSRFTTTA